ncbi:bifunctional UDP-sugar hydrolase/5'-nucleotidase [Corynebacterium jeikeium]|uniref:bifunctional metallophosphatase/5'-nucleotidase n=1 Tax=Corynebacterium jeikeium TaxID=38289 RepID=UPI0002E0C3CF|nr:bifunctional UDP-sugar hydrolase/5'-nucleotidase [Corynebacterium jeikeium]WCZ53597.1 Endonuclease YhcR precursor [Corynebacterium jeikeium]SUY81092.1 5'-nucleotidase [Corynebacterium jeikeium]
MFKLSRRSSRAVMTLAMAPTLALAGLNVPAYAAEADQVSLNIIGVTDFHGHLSQAKDRKGEIIEPGAAVMACYVNKEREGNPNTSFVSAGDNIGGSPFESSILKDKPTLDALNAMGLEASAVGNHEFDKGWSDLKDRVGVNGDKDAKFPYLGANVKGSDMAPSTVIEKGGVKIGYVGTITADTPNLVSPDGIQGLSFSEPVAATNAEAKRLKESGEADVVIGLVHEGMDNTKFSQDVDAVIAGHTHVLRKLDGKPVLVQPANYGMDLADIDIVYDKAAKKVVSVTAENRTAKDMRDVCGDTPDEDVAKIVSAAKESAKTEGEKVVTTLKNDFYRGANSDGESGGNRGTESSLNSMIADATLYGVNKLTDLKADLGVMNAGGVRADLASGDVTYAEAFAVQPFGNSLGVVEITGEQLKQALEQQWKPGGERAMLALGLSKNVQYAYDPDAEQGKRITYVSVNGKPLDPSKKYRVAGSSFLLNGGDSFDAFKGGKFQDAGQMDIDVFNRYLKDNKDIAVRPNQTSVGVKLSGAAVEEAKATDKALNSSVLAPKKDVTVNLSSLSYTGKEEKPTTATAKFLRCEGKKAVTVGEASAEMDNTVTDGLDETGKATVNLTVPEEAAFLQITTDAGSELNYPISVEGKLDVDRGCGATSDENTGAEGSLSGSSTGGIIGAILGILALIIGGATAIAWVQNNGGVPTHILPKWARDLLKI